MTDDPNAPTLPDLRSEPSSDRAKPKPPSERYVLRQLLGKGGMGEVWLANDVRIDREIAIKMMRSDGRQDPDAVARFLREARVQGRLEHPAIVPVHDLGGEDAAPYFAMKRLAGRTLAEVLAAQLRGDSDAIVRWPRRQLLARLVDVCLAVELAHQRGVIHRDLKPANIMLGDFGETYVLDWGLARVADVADGAVIRTSDLRGDSGSGETVAGTMLGTPGYMAPEQMRGEAIDHRTDIFAIGCILFEVLTGQPAVPRDAAIEVTLSAPSYRPSQRKPEADVALELDDLCAQCTTQDREQRPASARTIADAIQRFLDGDRDLAKRRELADEHAKRAALALLKSDNASRVEAMREAGRAVALDPGNANAKDVLAHLSMRLPDEIPPQVKQKIFDDQAKATQVALRTGAYAFFGFLVLIPLVLLLGTRNAWPLVSVAGLLVGLGTMLYVYSLKPRAIPMALYNLILVLHAGMIGLVGIIVGPLLIAPIIVIGSLATFISVPLVYAPRRTTTLLLAAGVMPVLLELAGVLPRTFHVDGSTIVFQPWAIDVSPRALVGGVLGALIIQVIVTATIFTNQRRQHELAQQRIHLQSWQLGHLIPEQ